MKLEVGMYCYNKISRKLGIGKIISFQSNNNVNVRYKNDIELVNMGNIIASNNITDLIEYMDLLEIQNPIKLYGKDTEISFFNPVRCDGFTTFEDGPHCIILNLDYLVDVKDLKIKSILTHESFENNCYKIGD